MSLITKIKTDQLSARKSKDAVASNLLTTLIGESEMVGKNDGNRESTDAEVVAVIKKFLKNACDTAQIMRHNGMTTRVLDTEIDILESYLPQQFDEEVLTQVLSSIKNEISAGPKDMGKMLGLLKTRFAGQYDGKMASDVAKKILTS